MLPKRLKQGDTIGIIAPASPPKLNALQKGIDYLHSLGLQTKLGPHVTDVYGYLAGKDEHRLQDLHEMFADPTIDGIICACGGYGTPRIASQIDYELIKNNPKVFWGYSDITYLHTAIRQQTGLTTFHGPMVSSDIGKDEFADLSKKMFQQLFEPSQIIYSEKISPLECLSDGIATGEITGGNLTLITSTLGTAFEIDTKGKHLLIEDVDEEPYRVDSMLNQLDNAGKIKDAAGVIVGDFKNARASGDKPSLTLDHVFETYLSNKNKPVMKGFNIGHCSPHISVPLGVEATLSTYDKTLKIQPGVKI